VTAAARIPAISSPLESGGISRSMIVPCILPDSNEKEELAKAFCIIAITIRPGATKLAKGTPSTSRPSRPSATVKITRNSRVVKAGAQIVCVWTLRNRRTSFI
jgi:hypothetical protein